MNSNMTVPERLDDVNEMLKNGNYMNFRDTLGNTWTLKDTPKFYKIESDAKDGECFLFEALEQAILFMVMMMVRFNE